MRLGVDVAKQTPFGSDDILGEQAYAATDAGNVDPTNAVPDVAKLWLQGLCRTNVLIGIT